MPRYRIAWPTQTGEVGMRCGLAWHGVGRGIGKPIVARHSNNLGITMARILAWTYHIFHSVVSSVVRFGPGFFWPQNVQ